MEKIQLFVLPIATLLWIGFFAAVLLQIFRTKTAMGRELFTGSPWGSRHPHIETLVTVLWAITVAPTIEELVFRMPLLILFDELTLAAWVAIVVMGVLFGFSHWINPSTSAFSICQADTYSEQAPGTIFYPIEDRGVRQQKLYHCILASGVGIILGCIVVVHQNIWYAVAIHFAWNLLTPLIILLGMYVVQQVRVRRAYREYRSRPREPQAEALI